MLVKTKIILVGERAGTFPWQYDKPDSVYDIKEIKIKYCCEPMEKAFEGRFIYFGEFPSDRVLNKNNEVNIFLCTPYLECTIWDEMIIKFCPWCKEKIQVKNIETEELKKED